MMTLDEARILQKREQKKSLVKFLVPTAIICIAFAFLFLYTDIMSLSPLFHLLPLLFLILAGKFGNIIKLFSPKIFRGEVVDVRVYRITERVSSGAGWGHGASGGTHFEAELLVKNKKGRHIFKTFWNGDVTSNLRPGDEIAILRFVDEPILIKGQYWESSI